MMRILRLTAVVVACFVATAVLGAMVFGGG